MNLGIVTPDQHESLIDLLWEMNKYYNPEAPESRDLARRHATDHLLSQIAPYHLVVACAPETNVIGLAAIAKVYSLVEPEPEKCGQIQLKELYAASAARSQGVGLALMCWVARYALDNDCHRIDWPVKATNVRGRTFYESLGAKQVEDRLSYRLAGFAFDRFVAGPTVEQP